MSSDTTKADQEAELARQAAVVAAVAKANAEELPLLGGTVTTEAPAPSRSLSTGTRKADLAKAEDATDG